jgi:predicted RNA-binding Zn-ribbon protein involved in translation (DUF1610 family)
MRMRWWRSHATILTRATGRESYSIFTSVRGSAIKTVETGSVPGGGTFFCVECGSHLSLLENDALPECPGCGGTSFGRDSIFETRQEPEGGQTSEYEPGQGGSAPDWLPEARSKLGDAGRYLACRDGEETMIFPIDQGWTRIGRSVAADIQLDDPSVSRRHALIVSERPDALRVLDDRSLNGVRLNGESIEWGRLADGDELTIGRYRLFVLEA